MRSICPMIDSAFPEFERIQSLEQFNRWVLRLQKSVRDVVSMYFAEKATGRKFEFIIERYHGSGGEWRLLQP